jgi:hypothetical protein
MLAAVSRLTSGQAIAKKLRAVDRAHHLAALRGHARAREARPGERVVVQIEQDAVVLERRRQALLRPLTGDVRAERVEPADHSQVSVLLELEPRGQRQVPAAALARDDDAPGVDAQARRVLVQPADARHAVVQARGERRHLRRRRGRERVAEVDHRHRDALRGDDPAPGAVHAVEARHRLHAAAVDVVHAGQRLARLRPDELNLDGVALGRGAELVRRDRGARGRRDLLVVHEIEHPSHLLARGDRLGPAQLRENAAIAALMRGSMRRSSWSLLMSASSRG